MRAHLGPRGRRPADLGAHVRRRFNLDAAPASQAGAAALGRAACRQPHLRRGPSVRASSGHAARIPRGGRDVRPARDAGSQGVGHPISRPTSPGRTGRVRGSLPLPLAAGRPAPSGSRCPARTLAPISCDARIASGSSPYAVDPVVHAPRHGSRRPLARVRWSRRPRGTRGNASRIGPSARVRCGSGADQMRSTKGGSSGGWCEETRSDRPARPTSCGRYAGQRPAAPGNAPAAGDVVRSLSVAGAWPVPVSDGPGAQQVTPGRSDAHPPSGAAQHRWWGSAAAGAGHNVPTRSTASSDAERRWSTENIAVHA